MARRWRMVAARLGSPTGDRRMLAPGGITNRDLPVPLSWQEKSAPGHQGSIVVGRVETVRYGDGMITATGTMLTEFPQYFQVLEQIEAGVTGPSLDLSDNIEVVVNDDGLEVITQAVFGGITLVPIEAFADVSITLEPEDAEPYLAEPVNIADPSYRAYGAGREALALDLATFASNVTAQRTATVVRPTADMFAQPDVDRKTPLVVTEPDELGRRRVFGHVAYWDTEHVGLPGRRAPRSRNGYASFMVSPQPLEDGSTLAVGTLVTGPRHASPELAFRAAQQHYDDLDCAVAKVRAGEDEFGIWVAGWVPPGVSEEKLEQFMTTAVSGDWRSVGGNLELIAVCSVNVPGFPTTRVRASFAAGAPRTVIASFGIVPRAGVLPGSGKKDEADTVALAQALWAWTIATESE